MKYCCFRKRKSLYGFYCSPFLSSVQIPQELLQFLPSLISRSPEFTLHPGFDHFLEVGWEELAGIWWCSAPSYIWMPIVKSSHRQINIRSGGRKEKRGVSCIKQKITKNKKGLKHIMASFNLSLINPWGCQLCTLILRFMAGGSHVKHLSSFSCGHQTLSWIFTAPECISFPQDKYPAIGNSCLPLLSSFFFFFPHIWLWVLFSKRINTHKPQWTAWFEQLRYYSAIKWGSGLPPSGNRLTQKAHTPQ